MVLSQVLGKFLGQPPSEGPWLHSGKNSRTATVKWKQVYLERYTLHRQTVDHPRRQEAPGCRVVSFYVLGNFIS